MTPGRAALALALALATTSTAHAGRARSPLDRLDADAAVIIAARPTAVIGVLGRLVGRLDDRAPALARSLAETRAHAGRTLGHDLASRDGWLAAGLDPDKPALASVGAIPLARARAVVEGLADAERWTDASLRRLGKVYWKTRVVAHVTSRRRVDRALRRLAARTPGLHHVIAGDAAAISMLLGGSGVERKRGDAVARLRGRGVIAVGWLDPLEAIVAVRLDRRRELLVIDILSPFAGVPVVWPRDGSDLLALLSRNARGSGLGAALPARVADALLREPLGLWLQPARAADAVTAASLSAATRSAAQFADPAARRDALAAAGRAGARCGVLQPLVARGPLTDLLLTAADATGALTVRFAWGLRRGAKLAAALAPADDGLFALGAPNAIAEAALYIRDLGAAADLVRPALLSDGDAALRGALAGCGAGAALAMAIGWPQLLAAALAAAPADQRAALARARNSAAAVRARDDDARSATLAVAASFPGEAADAARGALADNLARRGDDFAVPLGWPLGEQTAAVGAASDVRTARWFTDAAAGARPRGDAIARLAVDLHALGRLLGGDEATLRALAALGRVTGAVAIEHGRLIATVALGPDEP